MTPYERLLQDATPNCPELPSKQRTTAPRPWTPQEQAQHRADLEAALEGWSLDDNPRHLRAVPHAA
ncbi:hypothetical protein [Streptomyces wuyuanensis]|uniref:hypothetical protein n=1 Tax=Streptomyces wuyuanensis TaxID=1196353 RepID=UPI00378DA44B